MKTKTTTIIASFFVTLSAFSQQIGDGFATGIIPDFSAALKSGIYNGLNTSSIGMTPDNSNSWQHLFVMRHMHTSNNYQLQIASSFTINDKLFFRKIVASDLSSNNTAWTELATRGNNNFVGNQNITGNVGIGATIPRQKLEVIGLGAFSSSPSGSSLIIDGSALPTSNNYSNVRLIAGGDGGSGYLKSKLDNWGGYFSWVRGGSSSEVEVMRIDTFTGNVGIGTIKPAHKLDVIGTIRSREVKVDMNGADFVFEEKYSLMPLTELEAYVKKNKHLPEIATAKEMQEQGSNLGDLNTKLLQKIEELTLYVIEQQKLITQQAKELESHKVMLAKIDQMEKTLAKMNIANEK